MVKVGDIVVVTKRHDHNDACKGHLGILEKIDDHYVPYKFQFRNGKGSWCEDVRLATKEEIEAYDNGCGHIDDLQDYLNGPKNKVVQEILLTKVL